MTDLEFAESPIPLWKIRSYLKNRRWTKEVSAGSRFEIWSIGEGKERFEILLPLIASASDYSRRVENLISDLSGYLNKSTPALKQEILYEFEDRIYFRIDGDAVRNGKLPLTNTINMYQQIKKMVISSACSTIQRRSYHATSRPQDALDMAKNLQTTIPERGSYVIPLVNELPNLEEENEEPALPIDVETDRVLFPRRALTTLHVALGWISSMISEYESSDTKNLTEAVLDGLSSETCSAVSEILGTDGISSFYIDFGWASAKRIPRSGNHFSFSSDQRLAVAQIAEDLRGQDEISKRVFYGTVTKLERPVVKDEGNVTVSAIIDNVPRSVKMRLGDSAYRIALEANKERARVRVSGEINLSKSGNYKMTRVDSFERDFATQFI